jgi:hypothetical protein
MDKNNDSENARRGNENPGVAVSGSGYLSSEGKQKAEVLRTQTEPLIACLEGITATCHRALHLASLGDQSTGLGQQQVFATIVFARLLEVSEALVFLAKSGFGQEVNTLFRTFLETFFIFGNVAKDSAFIPKYLATDKYIRLKLMNIAEKRNEDLFGLMKSYASPEVKAALKQEIADSDAEDLKAYDIAANIGCDALYDSMYRICSAAAHSAPRSLIPYIAEGPGGEVIEIRLGPSLGDIPNRLYDVGWFLLQVLSSYGDVLQTDLSGDNQAFSEQLSALVKIE